MKNMNEAQRIYNQMMSGTKENKMTREEAVNKITNVWNSGGSLVDQLAALGLIKFEEKRDMKEEKRDMKDVVIEARIKEPYYEDFIKHLESNGYKIVPK